MTPLQHEPSAHAPCTRTMLGRSATSLLLIAAKLRKGRGRRRRSVASLRPGPQPTRQSPVSRLTTRHSRLLLPRETHGVSDAVLVVLLVVCLVVAVGGFVTGLRLVRRVRAEAEATNADHGDNR